MTILYKLFNIPGNLDEFLERLQDSQVKMVDICVQTRYIRNGTKNLASQYDLVLKGGKFKLRIKGNLVKMNGFHFADQENELVHYRIRKSDAVMEAYESAMNLKKQLQTSGLEVTLDGRNVSF